MQSKKQTGTEMTITHESAALIYGVIELALLKGHMVKELRASGYTLRDIVVLRSLIVSFREAYYKSDVEFKDHEKKKLLD